MKCATSAGRVEAVGMIRSAENVRVLDIGIGVACLLVIEV